MLCCSAVGGVAAASYFSYSVILCVKPTQFSIEAMHIKMSHSIRFNKRIMLFFQPFNLLEKKTSAKISFFVSTWEIFAKAWQTHLAALDSTCYEYICILCIKIWKTDIPLSSQNWKVCTNTCLQLAYVTIGIIFLCIGNSQWCVYNTQSKSDWPFNTQSRDLQGDWLILKNNGRRQLWTFTWPIIPQQYWGSSMLDHVR